MPRKGPQVVSPLLAELPPDLNYRVLFLQRDLDEVLASQEVMLRRRGEYPGSGREQMKSRFRSHLGKVRVLLERSPRFETMEVRYAALCRRPLEEGGRINAFLGGRLDEEAMAGSVDPSLCHHRAGEAPGERP